MKAITVCVDYSDILAITLPRNRPHFTECLVVTSLEDSKTKALADACGCHLFCTDAFTRHGAKFNKGLALHEAFEFWLGNTVSRDWVLSWDADILLHDSLLRGKEVCLKEWSDKLDVGKLYSVPRRILKEVSDWKDNLDWSKLTLDCKNLFAGYFQLFHTSSPALDRDGGKPWHDVTLAHAGGGDGFFQSRWPRQDKVLLPFEVLHIGPVYRNWCGRNNQAAFWDLHHYWQAHRTAAEHERYGMRVNVPGHRARPWVYGRSE